MDSDFSAETQDSYSGTSKAAVKSYRSQRGFLLEELLRYSAFWRIEPWIQEDSTVCNCFERSRTFVRKAKADEHLKEEGLAPACARSSRKPPRFAYLRLPQQLMQISATQHAMIDHVRRDLASFRIHGRMNLHVHVLYRFQVRIRSLKAYWSSWTLNTLKTTSAYLPHVRFLSIHQRPFLFHGFLRASIADIHVRLDHESEECIVRSMR